MIQRWLPILLLIPAAPALAQFGLPSSGSDPSGAQLIERERVVELVRPAVADSMRRALHDIADGPGEARAGFEPQALLKDALERYAEDLDKRLDELQGDGALTVSEVTESLEKLRERSLSRFKDVIEARYQGYPPPPLADRYDHARDYWLALAGYTLFVRNDWRAWLTLLAAITIGFTVALLLSELLRRAVTTLSSRQQTLLAEAVTGVRAPLLLSAGLLGLSVGMRGLWTPDSAEEAIGTTLTVAHLIALLWLFWNLCDLATTLVLRGLGRFADRPLGAQQHTVVRRIMRVLLIALFTVIATRAIFDASLTSLIAGLGVLGVLLWLVLRGLIENVAASFTLFSDKPFRIGDLLTYRDLWCNVERIGFRSTRLRTLDGHLLTVPNASLIDETIDNASARPYIRRRFRLSLTYDTGADNIRRALEIVKTVLDERRDQISDQLPPHAAFDRFGAYDLQLLVQYGYHQPDYWKAKSFASEVNLEIYRRFDEAGIAFAFPTQTTLLETAPGREPVYVRSDAENGRGGPAGSASDDRDDNDGNGKNGQRDRDGRVENGDTD